jgi:hypothetical protein
MVRGETRFGPGLQPLTKEHMENNIVISFDVEQVAAALEVAGFEVSEGNVADVVEYINNGGEIVEDFDAAFCLLVEDVATDLKIRERSQMPRNNQPPREAMSLDRFDINTGFLPTGEPRCNFHYHAMDGPEEHGGTVEWARCTRPATLRVRVTPAVSLVATDGSLAETYTPQPGKEHEEDSCAECYELTRREAGRFGNPAKVELATPVLVDEASAPKE